MEYTYDIYISFASLTGTENKQSAEWAGKFCEFLCLIMERLYGKRPSVLSHDRLINMQNLPGENNMSIFAKSAVFIVILSPESLQSADFLKELEEIRQAANYTPGSDTSCQRIFKAVTMPVSQTEQPDYLKSVLGYNFYEINRYNKKAIPLQFTDEKGNTQKLWSRMVDLAYDITASLTDLTGRSSENATGRNKPFIFLAETSFDQVENRDMLRRELQHLGYNILPLIPITEEANSAKQEIEKYLSQSIMAIHMLGAWYGDFIKNSKYSLLDFQIRTVKDYINNNPNITSPEQVIWIPSEIKPTDQRQSLYLKRLKRDEAQYKTEIIESPFEVFKTVLNNKLTELTSNVIKPVSEKNKLYVIYEKGKQDKILRYLDIMRHKGFEVIETDSWNGDFYSISRHIHNLLIADAVLIYKGDSTTDWLNSKIRDLVKAPGYGKSKPFRAVEIISSEKAADKSLIFLKNVPLNWDDEISSDVVNHFLEQLVKK